MDVRTSSSRHGNLCRNYRWLRLSDLVLLAINGKSRSKDRNLQQRLGLRYAGGSI